MIRSVPETSAAKKIPYATPKRMDRRDPRLRISELFDPDISERLWAGLPGACRVDHIDKKNVPASYVSSIRHHKLGGAAGLNRSTTIALSWIDLPKAMTQEMAWIVHREIELGRYHSPTSFNCATRVLRAAVSAGSRRARAAESLLHLAPHEWVREAHAARMRGYHLGHYNDAQAGHLIKRWQDVLVYAYHTGDWWQLNVWNPILDSRVPQRQHEPQGRNVANFSRLTSTWLREAAKWWLSIWLEAERYSWSSLKSRLESMRVLQLHVDERGDCGPTLVVDRNDLGEFTRSLAQGLRTRTVQMGPRKGQPLGNERRRGDLSAIETFYRFMYDNRKEAARVLNEPRWLSLGPEHTVLFPLNEKPRGNLGRPTVDRVLEDEVLSQIAIGSELLALPKSEGGLGDVQAFHAFALQMRTGRRVNEILLMDFDPLLPLVVANDTDQANDLVARMRYAQTKVLTPGGGSIPVDSEIVAIIQAQQAIARAHMARYGRPDETPRYLFLRERMNRLGEHPYSAATFHLRLSELGKRLDIRDSMGRPVAISQTHNLRHTKATSLLNGGVPLHVVMRYLGHVTPAMTMHYAQTLSETAEREFLKYKRITADGRELTAEASDSFDLFHLGQRTDRVLPNGCCLLPPKQSCDRGNACLSCGMFTTDESHREELTRQLNETGRLIDVRRRAFEGRYGIAMPDDNVWLVTRQRECASLRKILTTLDEVNSSPGPTAVRGAGADERKEPA